MDSVDVPIYISTEAVYCVLLAPALLMEPPGWVAGTTCTREVVEENFLSGGNTRFSETFNAKFGMEKRKRLMLGGGALWGTVSGRAK